MAEAHSDLWLVQHESHLSASGKAFQLEPYRIITDGDTVSALCERLRISATDIVLEVNRTRYKLLTKHARLHQGSDLLVPHVITRRVTVKTQKKRERQRERERLKPVPTVDGTWLTRCPAAAYAVCLELRGCCRCVCGDDHKSTTFCKQCEPLSFTLLHSFSCVVVQAAQLRRRWFAAIGVTVGVTWVRARASRR